ncbi:MAG: caspase family protein [Humidesulfovibrio sp.]|uniref:caspase family protein n=1 Tax=Humidesulfovibrio sp. TaxID=2910988 RepID=UPI0027EB87DE|nr:caspase family protein [Humidesulfovibrio sp.]MDQ7833913.1 caspase family protein [Humidesulfovibrio sp.]
MISRALSMLFAALLAAVLLSSPALASERRTALVIGNSAYKSAPLKNPVNDARDMAAALKGLGFEVRLLTDASHQSMEAAVREFGQSLRQGGVGLFYYAGHGIQVSGENYLVPVDAVIQTESDVKFGCLNAGLVLGKMEDAGNGLNVVILDACRNNPFARSFRSAERGLAKMDAPTGSLIAYATAPGSVASDGNGRNGVYTEHLLRNMRTPGLSITDVFMRVRIGVVAATAKKQVPWEASSLTGYFYFSGAPEANQPLPPASAETIAPAAPAPGPALDPKAERKRLAEEAARLKREKEELAQLQSLQSERERLEAERHSIEQAKLLALAPRPKQPPTSEAPAASHAAQFAQLARAGLPDARAYFEQAVQARPDDADARAGLAIALVFSGRAGDAKYHVQRLSESRTLTPGTRVAKGLMLGLEGNADSGYQLNRAMEEGADKALVLLCQAVAAERRNEMERAQKLMEDYADLAPEPQRGDFAKALALRVDLPGRLAGSYTWINQAGTDMGEFTFVRDGSGASGLSGSVAGLVDRDYQTHSPLENVRVEGQRLSFQVRRRLFFAMHTYKFVCDLSKGLDRLTIVELEYAGDTRSSYLYTTLVRKSQPRR